VNRTPEITEATNNSFSFRNDLPGIFIIAAAYFLAHGISFFFPDSARTIMLVWPAGGIGLASFLLNPRRLWPALILAFYFAGISADVLLSNRSFITAVGFMTGNMVESVGCASFILYISPDFQKFTRVKEILALLAGAVFINAFSACIGAGTSVLTRDALFFNSWRLWYIGDALGIFLICPFIVSWFTGFKKSLTDLRLEIILESIAFMFIWSIICYLVFYRANHNLFFVFSPYMLVALIAYPAVRLGTRGVTLALIILLSITILGSQAVTLHSPWFESNDDFSLFLIHLQIFLIFLAIVGYLFSAFYSGLKATEGLLQKSEVRYRTIIETAMDGFWIADLKGQLLSVNDAYCRITGYTRSELLNMNISDLEENENLVDSIAHIQKIISNGEDHFETRHRGKDGGFINFEINAKYYPGEKGNIVAFFHNITKRKKDEEALRDNEKLLRESQEIARLGSYVLDVKTGIWQSSEILDYIFGIDDKYIRSVEGWVQIIHPEFRDLMADYLSNNVLGKHELFDKNYKIVRKNDGDERWVHGLGKLEFDSNFQPVKMIGTISDITEQKHAEDELIMAKEKAESASKLKDAFIANISHEIRTPLNGVLGLTSLIKETYQSFIREEDDELFEGVDISSRRIIRTIDMILNYSRLQVGEFKIRPGKTNISKICKSLAKEFMAAAKSKSIDLSFQDNCGDSDLVADGSAIMMAISNLIDNAIKFTNKGFVRIILNKGNNNEIILEIKDSGVGINANFIDHIYEPYGQEQMGYGRAYDGIGLGLAIVKKILDLNNAGIKVQSKKDEGTTFTINFGKKELPSGNKSVKEETDGIHGAPDLSQNKMVLIVEDDLINQVTIKKFLDDKYKCLTTDSSDGALEILKTNKVDIILMDISISGCMNGLELTKELKRSKEFSHIPVIAVTAHAFESDHQNAINAGCDGYLAKPFTKESLLNIIYAELR
jgi:PAS domain S-box-containing protein